MPERWAWCRIKHIGNVVGGGTPKTNIVGYWDGNIPWISPADLSGYTDMYISCGSRKITESGLCRSSAQLLPKGTVLYSSRAPIGYIAIAQNAIATNQGFKSVVPYTGVISEYIYYCLMARKDNIIMRATGTTFKEISGSQMKETLIPIPPFLEQREISNFVLQIFKNLTYISNERNKLINIIKLTKSKILDLAICGQLVSQNPDDEPVSVLLERIRAEKEELIKQGKIKRDKKESIIFKGDDNSYFEKIDDDTFDITDSIPFEIPDNWEFIRFKEIWGLVSGRDLTPTEYNDKNIGIPYITGASNFNKGNIELVRWTSNPQVITHTGDLLITCKGTIGEMAFNYFGDAHIARQIMAIRNIFNLNTEYLSLCIYYYINTIKESAKGLIPGISREDILNLLLPLPPIDYQNKVVFKIKKINNILHIMEKSLNYDSSPM